MNELLKIKLTIADRTYPLSVEASQEELLRKSAKKIEAMMKQLEESYAVRDKRDLLAMCALQYATQLEKKSNTELKSVVIENEKINHLNEMIENHMTAF